MRMYVFPCVGVGVYAFIKSHCYPGYYVHRRIILYFRFCLLNIILCKCGLGQVVLLYVQHYVFNSYLRMALIRTRYILLLPSSSSSLLLPIFDFLALLSFGHYIK